MPEDDYVWLPREDILHFEEISALVDCFVGSGVDRVRLTGGEPLLAPRLCRRSCGCSRRKPGLRDLALTTNGILLADQRRAARRRPAAHDRQPRHAAARPLPRADRRRRARRGARQASPPRAACSAGSRSTRVVMRGVNDDELVDLIEYGRADGRRGPVHRVHGRRRRDALVARQVVSRPDDPRRSGAPLRAVEPIARTISAPADRYRLPDGTVFGIISSTTAPFCRAATAAGSRPTACGTCACMPARGIDLRAALRARGIGRATLAGIIARRLARAHRPRRRRAAGPRRTPRLRADPRRCAGTRTSRCTPAAGNPQVSANFPWPLPLASAL